MIATRYDIKIWAGSTFNLKVDVLYDDDDETPFPLAGYTACMPIKEKAGSSSLFLDATTENGYISINLVTSRVTVEITPTDTAIFPWILGIYHFDLIHGSLVHPVLYGEIAIIKR